MHPGVCGPKRGPNWRGVVYAVDLTARGGEGGRTSSRRGATKGEFEVERRGQQSEEGESDECEWWLNESGLEPRRGRHVVESEPFRFTIRGYSASITLQCISAPLFLFFSPSLVFSRSAPGAISHSYMLGNCQCRRVRSRPRSDLACHMCLPLSLVLSSPPPPPS